MRRGTHQAHQLRVVDPRKDALAAKNSCRDHGAPMSSAPLEEAYDEAVVRQAFEEAWMVYDEETGALEDGLAQPEALGRALVGCNGAWRRAKDRER